MIRNDPGADAAGFKLSPASQLKHISVHHDFFDLMLDPTEPDADHYRARLGNGDSRGPEASSRVTTGFWIILSVFGFRPPLCQKSVLELTENTHVRSSS